MERIPVGSPAPVILFDGVCNLCETWVVNVIDRDPYGNFHFAPLQSVAAERILREAGAPIPPPGAPLDTVIVVEGTQILTRSDALIRIARGLRWPWSMLALCRWFPRGIRDGLYRWVARNRHQWFGRKASCMVPTETLLLRFVPGSDQMRAPGP